MCCLCSLVLVAPCAPHVGLTCRHSNTNPKHHPALQDDFLEVTKDYPEAWHSMNLVAEHRIRMLHSSPAFTQWQDNQKKHPSPSSKLSIKIEQVLEVPTCLQTLPIHICPVLQYTDRCSAQFKCYCRLQLFRCEFGTRHNSSWLYRMPETRVKQYIKQLVRLQLKQ